MCFGGKPAPLPTPAPPPPPPEQPPDVPEIGAARRSEQRGLYGSETPSLRIDRSLGAGVTAGGSGLRM